MKNTHHIINTKNCPIQYHLCMKRTGQEIAWRYHWISTDALKKQIEGQKSSYYAYVREIIK